MCVDAKLFTLTPVSRPLKLKRCAELDGAARLRLNSVIITFVRPNPYFGGRNSVEMPAVRANPLFAGREAIELAHQNHFGSDCAPEACRMASPAKVELKKSHFGKPSLTECTLRYPRCQSELAEGPVRGQTLLRALCIIK